MGSTAYLVAHDPDKVPDNIAWCKSQGLDASTIIVEGLTVEERAGELVLAGQEFVLDHAGRKTPPGNALEHLKRPFEAVVTSLPPTAYTYRNA